MKTTNGFLKNVPQVRLRPFYDKWTNSEEMHDLSFDSSNEIVTDKTTNRISDSQLKDTDRQSQTVEGDNKKQKESDGLLEIRENEKEKDDGITDRQIIDNIDEKDDELEETDSQPEIDIGQFSDMSLESPSLNSHIIIVFKSDPRYHYDVIVKKLNKSILTFIDKFDNKIKAHKRKDLMFKYFRSDRVNGGTDPGHGDDGDRQVRERQDHADQPVREERDRDCGGWRQPPQVHVPHPSRPDGPEDRSSGDQVVHCVHLEESHRQRRRDILPHPPRHSGGAERPDTGGGRVKRPEVPLGDGHLRDDPADAAEDGRNLPQGSLLHPAHGDPSYHEGGGQGGDGRQLLHPHHGYSDHAGHGAVCTVARRRQDGREAQPGDTLLLQEDTVHADGVPATDEELPLRDAGVHEDVLHHAEGDEWIHRGALGDCQHQRDRAHGQPQLHRLEEPLLLDARLHEEPHDGARQDEEGGHQREPGVDKLLVDRQQGDSRRHRQVEAGGRGGPSTAAGPTAAPPWLEAADRHIPLPLRSPWKRARKRRKRRIL